MPKGQVGMPRNDGTQIPSEGTISTETQARQLRPEVRYSEVADLFARGIRRNGGEIINRLTGTHGTNRIQGPSLP